MSRNPLPRLLLLALAAGGCGVAAEAGPAADAGRRPSRLRRRPPADPATAVPGGLPDHRGDAAQRLRRGHRRRARRRRDADARLLRHPAAARAGARRPAHGRVQRARVLLDPRPDGLRRPERRGRRGGARCWTPRRACPVEESGPGSELLTEVRASAPARGPPPWSTPTRTGGRVGLGAEIIEVVPRGHRPARHVVVRRVESRPDPRRRHRRRDVEALAPVLEAMRAFGEARPRRRPDASRPSCGLPARTSTCPEDGGDYDVVAPSPEADGVGEVEVCGSTALAGRARRRRGWRSTPTGPSTSTPATSSCWPTPTSPRPWCRQVRGVVEGCTDAPAHQVWTLHGADTGHDSVTFSLTWDNGPRGLGLPAHPGRAARC